jgi:hypothetical protein
LVAELGWFISGQNPLILLSVYISDSEDCPGDFPCDFSINYSSLDALEAEIATLGPYCVHYYMLSVLYGELDNFGQLYEHC